MLQKQSGCQHPYLPVSWTIFNPPSHHTSSRRGQVQTSLCCDNNYIYSFTDFHQLACEAEGELKEMEEILALLPPPSPPPLSPPPPPHPPATSVTTTDTFLGKAVDSSIACVLNEMTEIEGTRTIYRVKHISHVNGP